MWTLRLALTVIALTRAGEAFASAGCTPPILERTADGVTVAFEHQDGWLTLTFRREGEIIGERVLDVRDVACDAVVATAALLVELTLEELAFAEAERARASAVEAHRDHAETLPELLIEVVVAARAAPAQRTANGAPVPPPSAPSFRLGTTADVGLAVALSGPAAVVSSAVFDVAYAPEGDGLAPEVSGRGGVFGSLPSRSRIDERDVWLSVIASRWDLCGGVRTASFRARGCAGALAGSMLAQGAETSTLVSIGTRLEGAWQATPRAAILIAAEAMSLQLPREINVIVEDWASPVREEVSPLSLVFSTGVTGDWLTL